MGISRDVFYSLEIPFYFQQRKMVDYKEVKLKDGRVLVFCNFEELLKDFYGVSSMEEH